MKLLLSFQTLAGTFYIGQDEDGYYHPIYDGESLGAYSEAWQATEDLAANVTYSVLHERTGKVLDTSKLGIPDEPSSWERMR